MKKWAASCSNRFTSFSVPACTGQASAALISEKNFVPADKAAHFIAFYGLTALMMVAFPKNRRLEITLAAVMLGGSIEVAQMVTHRGVSFSDLAADAAGAFAVWIPMWIQSLRSPPVVERRRRAGDRVPEVSSV